MPVLSGIIRDDRGQPVAGASVYFTDAPVAVPDVALQTGPDGRFALGAPVAGSYELGVNAGGNSPTTLRCEVPPDGITDLTIQLPA